MSYCRTCGHYRLVTGDGLCQSCNQSYYEQLSQWPEIWEESDTNPEG